MKDEKKKCSAETVFGLLPKLYCEKKKLYCKAEIVLQGVAGLYCSLGKKMYCRGCIVLQ